VRACIASHVRALPKRPVDNSSLSGRHSGAARGGGGGEASPHGWTSKKYVISVCSRCHGTSSYHTTNTLLYKRPIDPYLTSPSLLQNPGGATGPTSRALGFSTRSATNWPTTDTQVTADATFGRSATALSVAPAAASSASRAVRRNSRLEINARALSASQCTLLRAGFKGGGQTGQLPRGLHN